MTEHGVPDNRRTRRRKQAHDPEGDPQPDVRRTDNRKQAHRAKGGPVPDPRHRTQQEHPDQQLLDFAEPKEESE